MVRCDFFVCDEREIEGEGAQSDDDSEVNVWKDDESNEGVGDNMGDEGDDDSEVMRDVFCWSYLL